MVVRRAETRSAATVQPVYRALIRSREFGTGYAAGMSQELADRAGNSDDSADSRPDPVGNGAPAETAPSGAFADPAYHVAIADLLGVLAYSELTAFERLTEDAATAPTLQDKVALAAMAAAQFAHFERLRDRMLEIGVDPFDAMEPFHAAVDAFHAHTAPSNWLERLIKAYVGDGLAADFYREIAAYVDADTRDLIVAALDDTGHSQFAVDRVREAIAADPKIAGRLALWARRLMGEALSQAQRVAADREPLSALLVGGVDRPGMDLAAVGRMFARLAETHTARMAALGLQA